MFRVAVDGVISEVMDATGDGIGHLLDGPSEIAVDIAGNVYVSGLGSDNAFMIASPQVLPSASVVGLLTLATMLSTGAAFALRGTMRKHQRKSYPGESLDVEPTIPS